MFILGGVRPHFVIMWGALLTGAANSLFLRLPSYIRNYWGDWSIFWNAAHIPEDLYTFEISKFPYPPTTLLFLRPFAALPMWPSLVIWSLVGLFALYHCGKLIAPKKAVLLALLMPAIFWCVLAGQTALFLGALAIAAVAKRSGVLFGLGIVLKPHYFLALPFMDWSWSLAARAVVSASALIVLSIILFGWHLWPNWTSSLPAFADAASQSGMRMLSANVTGLAHNLGLPLWVYYIGAVFGAAATFITVRATNDNLDRYASFAAGSLLISPYALGYDLAGLSIAAMAMLLDPRRSALRWIAAGWLVSGVFVSIGIIALAAVLAWEAHAMRHHSTT